MDTTTRAINPTTDDDDDDFKIKGKGKQPVVLPSEDASKDAPQDTCVICLEHITERAVAVPCNHLNFDFLCLVSWLQEQSFCPLCKTATVQVQYDWRSPTDYKSYKVDPPTRITSTSTPNTSNSSRRLSTSQPFRFPQRGRGYRSSHPRSLPQPTPDAALAFRRNIYLFHSFSLHVGANRASSYQNFTPSIFASDTHLQSRARTFMRRELQVFGFLSANVEFVIEYIVAVLKKADIKGADGVARELVKEFLGERDGELFLHELDSWLRSPFERLQDWDRNVQYALPNDRKRLSTRMRLEDG